MAKKTARDLDKSPLAVAEAHHAKCQAKLEGIWKEIDKMFDKSGDDLRKGFTMADLDKKLAEHARAVNETMQAAVTLQRHMRGEVEERVEPAIPEEDVRSVLIDVLADKTDELSFKVNNGLLASAIAQAIRMDVTEDTLDAPLCRDRR